MFPYRAKYTESESDIQNNDLLYKSTPRVQNKQDCLKMFGETRKFPKLFDIWYMIYDMIYDMTYDIIDEMTWYDIWYDIWYAKWYDIWYMI